MKKLIIIITALIFHSCGWNDAQSITKSNLINNYKIIQDVNDIDAGYKLIENDSENSNGHTVLINNCTEIYFNSKYIYVKSLNYDKSINYSFFLTKTKANKIVSNSIKKISKSKFDKSILACENCKNWKSPDGASITRNR